MIQQELNLTGRGRLYKGDVLDFDIEQEVESLKMRLEEEDLFVYTTPRQSPVKNNGQNFFLFKEALYSGGVFFATQEGPTVTISLTPRETPEIALVQKGFIRTFILPLLDDSEYFDYNTKTALWFLKVFNTLDVSNIFSASSDEKGRVFFNNVDEEAYKRLRKEGIVGEWEINEKLLIFDFIYNTGRVDSGKLALYTFLLLNGQSIPKSLKEKFLD